MKTKKKGGFTLVELLVVIAILAILSTVSIVGYTSFMQRAAVSNDENVASQINNFLTALRVDSSSEYYGEEITVHNIRDIRDTIMREGGLSSLAPQAEKYGYHFYYDLQEEKVVLKQDDDVRESLSRSIFALFASAAEEEYEITPANCFTLGGRYVLLDDENSALGAAIDAFYKVESQADIEAISSLIDDCGVFAEKIRAYLGSVVIITNSGNYALGSAPYVRIAFAQGVTTINKSVETLIAESVTKLSIPSSVKFIEGGALNAENTALVIEFNRTPEEIGKMAFEGFTNANIGTTNGIYNCTTGAEDGAFAGRPVIRNGNDVSTEVLLGFDNPAHKIELEIKEEQDKVVLAEDNKSAFFAYDKKEFTIISKITGDDDITPAFPRVEWEVIKGGEYLESLGDGKFSYKAMPTTSEAAEIIIKAKITDGACDCVDGENAPILEAEYKIFTVALISCKAEFVGGVVSDTINASPYVIDFKPDEAVNLNIALTNKQYTYECDGIKLDETCVVTGENNVDYGNGTFVLAAGTVSDTLIFTFGEYKTCKVKVAFRDKTEDIFEIKNPNIMYIGSKGEIYASDLYKFTVTDPVIPVGATLRIFSGTYADQTNYDLSELEPFGSGSLKIDETKSNLSVGSDLSETKIVFTGTVPQNEYGTSISICLAIGDTRISKMINITVKDATNIRSYTSSMSNVVLLNDIAISENGTCLPSGALWGNGFTFDVTKATTTYGVIVFNQNGSIHDLKIIGKVYSNLGEDMALDPWSAATVFIGDGTVCTIDNCYISNSRTPIFVSTNATLDLKDSVIFGGRLGNIGINGGATLNIYGNVTTIQREVLADDGTPVIGVGIVGWTGSEDKNLNIKENSTFKQYNFISEDEGKNLPTISVDIIFSTIKANLSDIFVENFIKNNKYSSHRFTDANGKTYVNSGVIAIKNLKKFTFAGYVDYETVNYIQFGVSFDIYTPKPTSNVHNDTFNEYLELGDRFDPQNAQFNKSASGCKWQAKAGNAQ